MNKKSNTKNILWGLLLILLAVYLVVSKLGMLPQLPFFTVVFSVFFAVTAIHGLIKGHFWVASMSVGILGCIHDEFLGITEITPWILLVAACIIGIGLEMLFKGCKRHHGVYIGTDGKTNKFNDHIENTQDGREVVYKNSFGSVSKYINSGDFQRAHFSNSFGQSNIYFNNAIIHAGQPAIVSVENSFGEMNLFIPNTWRVHLTQNVSFGDLKIKGQGNNDVDAPTVELSVSSSFGDVNVIFE